ncbi:MAG: precorrin-6A reductase [Desulfobacteraceae bacterium 4572_35.1]|nr:MAG: precorrin-6A reductase [Desulfobacteraceae bacterium 4572_35.1]
MILVFGGTSETAGLAMALAQSGHPVLVSTATDAPLDVGVHPAIRRRCGRLDRDGIVALIVAESIRVVVDGSHPYALQLHASVAAASQRAQVPCFRYQRQMTAIAEEEGICFVADHFAAAALAVKFAVPVLLTIGSRQLDPYVELLKKHHIPLYARVLPYCESEQLCERAGLPVESRIVGRGPFSETENRNLIRNKKIGLLVTKDSGIRGGVVEKISAARRENCQVIVVRRPSVAPGFCQVFEDVGQLVAGVSRSLFLDVIRLENGRSV